MWSWGAGSRIHEFKFFECGHGAQHAEFTNKTLFKCGHGAQAAEFTFVTLFNEWNGFVTDFLTAIIYIYIYTYPIGYIFLR